MQIKESGCGVVLPSLEITDRDIELLDKEICAYVMNYKEISERAKKYVFSNRVWASNEEKLKALYSELGI